MSRPISVFVLDNCLCGPVTGRGEAEWIGGTPSQPQHQHPVNGSSTITNNFASLIYSIALDMNVYQYSPLPKDRSEFRLVRLLPGPTSAEIEIEIFHAARSSRYEALSYAWGAPERTDVALVRGQVNPTEPAKPLSPSKLDSFLKLSSQNEPSLPRTTIGITHNLAVALRHLRDEKSPRVLWIDALCINQDDLVERSVEVLDMGSIYSLAEQVVVWTGPSSEDTGLALTTLRAIGSGVYVRDGYRLVNRSGSWALSLWKDLEALKSQRPNWFAIRNLLRREWFSRLWVLQEVGLATNAILYAGQHTIDWKIFVLALEWTWGILAQINELIQGLEFEDFGSNSIHGFITLSRELQDMKRPALSNLLAITSYFHCSDPRDRLYAIRDLTRPEDRKDIVPDYSIRVENSFRDYALRRFQAERRAGLLEFCLLRNTSSKLLLPSWVPDFSLTDRPAPILDFYASGSSEFCGMATDESLTVQGVKVAAITSLFTLFNPGDTNIKVLKACKSWETSFTSSIYTGGSKFEAFIDAILLGSRGKVWPEHSLLNLEECKTILDTGEVNLETDFMRRLAGYFVSRIRTNLHQRAFFRTQEGFLGVCPESANHGDLVALVLGFPWPLVIRPVQHQLRPCYRIVGPCYMPGAMHTELLLGQLPAGWEVSYLVPRGAYLPVIFGQGNMWTQQDPRVPLPPGWRYRYGSFNAPRITEPAEPAALEDMPPQFFENEETKEKTWFDPRLTPEALRYRGINVQELVFV
ncbi:Heterokaryon incompatibility protein (HET) domain containing protein [Hyaloscypha variabilis]